MLYKGKNSTYEKRALNFERNKSEAYTLIEKQCSDNMISRVRGRSDCGTLDKDPIKLLEAIHEQTMQFNEDECDVLTLLTAHHNSFNIRQGEEEDLNPCHDRFQNAMNDFVRLNGDHFMFYDSVKEDTCDASAAHELQANQDQVKKHFD